MPLFFKVSVVQMALNSFYLKFFHQKFISLTLLSQKNSYNYQNESTTIVTDNTLQSYDT